MSSTSPTSRAAVAVPAIAIVLSLSGCRVIGDIFKVGMGVGIFMVVVVVAIVGGIAALVSRKS